MGYIPLERVTPEQVQRSRVVIASDGELGCILLGQLGQNITGEILHIELPNLEPTTLVAARRLLFSLGFAGIA